VQPDQIIVVDGGKSVKNVLEEFPNFEIDYAYVDPASLTVQRNVGLSKVRQSITLIAFFDDDIEFLPDSLRNMMEFWEAQGDDVGAAAFNNMSERHKMPGLLGKIFFSGYDIPGKITAAGFQSIPCSLDRTLQVEWLIGCSMVYRAQVFNEFMFDEWYAGYARYEDVDFSYTVGRKYKMFVVADAKVLHHVQLEKVENSRRLGKMQIINRLYFVRKNHELSVGLCYWALIGLTINNMIKGYFFRDERNRLRFLGNMSAFAELLRSNEKAFSIGERTWG
jgi:glycosyltransferase involved in cell wall biosynthesis